MIRTAALNGMHDYRGSVGMQTKPVVLRQVRLIIP